jgi:5,6-dimethylbenzimidazole synthase
MSFDPQEFPPAEKRGVYQAIYRRRDMRTFLNTPIPDALLARLLHAAHHAGSVGFMQPWNFILTKDLEVKQRLKAVVDQERLATATDFGEPRGSRLLALKVEGILEAPVVICVTCDPTRRGPHVLGRHSDPRTDVYSVSCAIQNLWLAARAEGIGMGWVTFFRKEDLRPILGIPEHIDPIALLCLGYVPEFPERPLLEVVGWEHRDPLEAVVFFEAWGRQEDATWEPLREDMRRLNRTGGVDHVDVTASTGHRGEKL